jgi:hypothetical protein
VTRSTIDRFRSRPAYAAQQSLDQFLHSLDHDGWWSVSPFPGSAAN